MPKKPITLAQMKARQRGDTSTRAQSDRLYDAHSRDKRIRGFYNSALWQRTRNLYRSHHPLCEPCLDLDRTTAAEQVHHKVKITHRWDLRCEPTNLMSVCRACHAVIEGKA